MGIPNEPVELPSVKRRSRLSLGHKKGSSKLSEKAAGKEDISMEVPSKYLLDLNPECRRNLNLCKDVKSKTYSEHSLLSVKTQSVDDVENVKDQARQAVPIKLECFAEEDKVPPIASLHNLGNTCFLNCMLEILRFTPGFIEGITELQKRIILGENQVVQPLKHEHKAKPRNPSWEFVKSLNTLYRNMEEKENDYSKVATSDGLSMAVRPTAVLQSIRKLNSMFEGNLQHDAQELLRCLLCYIEDAEKEVKKIVQDDEHDYLHVKRSNFVTRRDNPGKPRTREPSSIHVTEIMENEKEDICKLITTTNSIQCSNIINELKLDKRVEISTQSTKNDVELFSKDIDGKAKDQKVDTDLQKSRKDIVPSNQDSKELNQNSKVDLKVEKKSRKANKNENKLLDTDKLEQGIKEENKEDIDKLKIPESNDSESNQTIQIFSSIFDSIKSRKRKAAKIYEEKSGKSDSGSSKPDGNKKIKKSKNPENVDTKNLVKRSKKITEERANESEQPSQVTSDSHRKQNSKKNSVIALTTAAPQTSLNRKSNLNTTSKKTANKIKSLQSPVLLKKKSKNTESSNSIHNSKCLNSNETDFKSGDSNNNNAAHFSRDKIDSFKINAGYMDLKVELFRCDTELNLQINKLDLDNNTPTPKSSQSKISTKQSTKPNKDIENVLNNIKAEPNLCSLNKESKYAPRKICVQKEDTEVENLVNINFDSRQVKSEVLPVVSVSLPTIVLDQCDWITPLSTVNVQQYERRKSSKVKRLCRKKVKTQPTQDVENGREQALLEGLFAGTMMYRTRCLECESHRDRLEAFVDVGVPVRVETSDEESDSDTIVTAPDSCFSRLMAALFSVERLVGVNKYFCSDCWSYTEAQRSCHYTVMPDVLTLHLKRFSQDPKAFGGVAKVIDKVNIPSSLPCLQYGCTGGCTSSCHRYSLYGVVTHSGVSLLHGHYRAYVRMSVDFNSHIQTYMTERDEMCETGYCWAELDDECVRLMDEVEFQSKLDESCGTLMGVPYVLFYHRDK